MASVGYMYRTVVVPGTTGSVRITGINNAGQLAGDETPAGVPYPAAWIDTDGTAIVYGANGLPYGQHSAGGAINNLGQTVGSSGHYQQTARGYLYDHGIITKISGPNDGYMTTARGINDAGQVVGGASEIGPTGSQPEAFVWQSGTMTLFGYPGATSTTATGINNTGEIVGSYSTGSGDHGFSDINGQFAAVDVPGAVSTDPAAVNLAGVIAGSYFDGTHYHGFVDNAGQMIFINAPGATDTWVTGINDNGDLSGYYDTQSFEATTGFVALDPPARVGAGYDLLTQHETFGMPKHLFHSHH